MNESHTQLHISGSTIVGGVGGLAIGFRLFHMPFGMGGSDYPILICGLIGAGIGYYLASRWPRESDQASPRGSQPPLLEPRPSAGDYVEVSAMHDFGRLCRLLFRAAHGCVLMPHPFFRVTCCVLGGALLGHLVHATFFGGALGLLPRQFDLAGVVCLALGAIGGMAWGLWGETHVAVVACRPLCAREQARVISS